MCVPGYLILSILLWKWGFKKKHDKCRRSECCYWSIQFLCLWPRYLVSFTSIHETARGYLVSLQVRWNLTPFMCVFLLFDIQVYCISFLIFSKFKSSTYWYSLIDTFISLSFFCFFLPNHGKGKWKGTWKGNISTTTKGSRNDNLVKQTHKHGLCDCALGILLCIRCSWSVWD